MKRLLALTALVLLAGCGIKSGLERPDPMWGSASARAAEAERTSAGDAARAERAARRGLYPEATPTPQAGTPPLTSPDPVAPSQTPTPPTTTP